MPDNILFQTILNRSRLIQSSIIKKEVFSLHGHLFSNKQGGLFMGENRIANCKIERTFKIYLEDLEVCRINLAETYFDKEATLEVFDKESLPIELGLQVKKETCNTKNLIGFLKGRVLPYNRMFLGEDLAPYGIGANDWLAKLKLNKGRACEDEYWIEVEKKHINLGHPEEQGIEEYEGMEG